METLISAPVVNALVIVFIMDVNFDMRRSQSVKMRFKWRDDWNVRELWWVQLVFHGNQTEGTSFHLLLFLSLES